MGTKNNGFYMDIMCFHREVTGSCNLCVLKLPDKTTKRFLVDCGLFQEGEYSELNSELLFTPASIEFALITHNHVDHIGKLPYIVKKGFEGKIYATNATCHLLPYALYDSRKVLNDVAKRNHTVPLYSEKNVEEAIRLLTPCNYNETINIDENIKVTFFNNNGHLLGAAMILVQVCYPGYENINVLFTGDYNNKNIFMDLQPLPEWVLELPLTIVTESTYGNMDSNEIEKCFRANVSRCIESGGTVIAPVFSLGRAQEVLYELKCMQKEAILDTNIPIYLDGKLAIKYTSKYLKDVLGIKPEMMDFLPENFRYVDDSIRQSLLNDTNSKIILTTAGMGSYGPAQVYIPEYITRENALIHFTGYTAEGTLGRKLKDAQVAETVNIGSLIVKKRAQVEYTTEYSAHAKANEIIEFLKGFKNLKLVLVNHGEAKTQEIFANRVVEEVDSKRVGILNRSHVFRITPYGLEKTLPTKFM